MKQGWEVRKIAEIGAVFNGNSINAKLKKEKYTNLKAGYPYITTKDISYKSVIDYDNGVKIPDEDKSSFKMAPKNTILICAEGGSAGRKIAFTNQEVCFGNKLFALLTADEVNSRFVYYYYFSPQFQEDFASQLTGIIGGVSMAKFKKLKVPLPSPTEQQRIVEILDKVFVAIDKAKQNAEQNLSNAKEVFENYLQGVFDDKTIQWDRFILKDLLQEQPRNGWSPPLKYHSEIGIPVLTLSAVTGFEFDVEKCKYTTAPTDKASYYWLKNGNLLISRSNTPELVGHVAISNNIESPTIYPDLIMKMKPKKSLVSTSFLYYQLRSSKLRKEIMMRAHGANPTMKKINKTDVQSLPILLCDKETQNQIVANLDQLLEKIKIMEGIYQRKINSIMRLKKSILQKVFTGEL